MWMQVAGACAPDDRVHASASLYACLISVAKLQYLYKFGCGFAWFGWLRIASRSIMVPVRYGTMVRHHTCGVCGVRVVRLHRHQANTVSRSQQRCLLLALMTFSCAGSCVLLGISLLLCVTQLHSSMVHRGLDLDT